MTQEEKKQSALNKLKPLAAAESKSLATISHEDMMSLAGSTDTGFETTSGNNLPQIKMLSSDKQYKLFADAEEIKMSDYGKLFVQRSGLTRSDLTEAVECIFIKASFGHLVYPPKADGRPNTQEKPMASYRGMVRKAEADDWSDRNPGRAYQNQVRVVICLAESMAEAQAMIAVGENPCALLVLKGVSFGAWFGINDKMDESLKEYMTLTGGYPEGTKSSTCKSPVFKFRITAKSQMIEAIKTTVYVPEIAVSINPPELALSFMPMWRQFKMYPLFDSDERQKADVQVDGYGADGSVPDDVIAAAEPKGVQTINPDDLPFN